MDDELKQKPAYGMVQLIKEVKVYEMPWDDFVEGDLPSDKWGNLFSPGIDWEFTILEPRHPIESIGFKGWVRFTFERNYKI